MIGRLDTKWFSCGFCTERWRIVRESGHYSMWLSVGYHPNHARVWRWCRGAWSTHFPWGRAVRRLKESLLSRAERARLRRD